MPMGPLAFGAQPSPGQVLRHTGSGFDWTTLNGLTDVAGLAANRLLFGSASGLIAQSANLTYTSGTGLTIADSTASTTTATGALVVSGGAGVGGAINIFSQALICNAADTTAILCAGGNNVTNTILTGTTQLSFKANIVGSSAATTGVRGFSSAPSTTAAAFSTSYVAGFFAGAATAGAASTITRSIGYTARRQTAGTNNFGYVYTTDETAITGQWAFFSNTTDASSLNGSVLIGTTTDDGVNKLQVNGAGKISSSTASTSSTTGALVVTGGIGVGGGVSIAGTLGVGVGATATALQITTTGNNGIVLNSDSRQLYFGWTGGVTAFGSLTADAVNFVSNGAARISLPSAGSVVIGTAALATNATVGFIYMPTCAGTPTGVPTAFTGTVAWVYDTTNNKICVYNGAWKQSVALT